MQFAVLHPGFRTCDDCQKWVYEPDNLEGPEAGKPKFWGSPPVRVPRPTYSPTPCQACPKCAPLADKSPQGGKTVELSEKNLMTWELYMTLHAARLDGEQLDARAVRNMALIHSIVDGNRK